MKLNGNVNNVGNGMLSSIKAMQLQMAIVDIHSDNVVGFDKVGYQRKVPQVSSFTEYLGVEGLSKTIDNNPGRIVASKNKLDFALKNKGYFQCEGENGVRLTRDGRFKINKEGNLLNLNDEKVLSYTGTPIKFPFKPENTEDIKVDYNGVITAYNKNTNKIEYIDTISVVSSDQLAIINPGVLQGYNEDSNVSLQNEFVNIFPVTKNFDANRQMYIIQSNNLTKVISEIGKV